MWDIRTGRHSQPLRGHTRDVTSIAFSPDGNTLASGGGFGDGTVRLWDAYTGKFQPLATGATDGFWSLAFSRNGDTLAGAGGWLGKTVRIWDTRTGEHLHTLQGHSDRVTSVVFSPDGTTLVSGSWDDTIRLWDAHTGDGLLTLQEHAANVTSLAFSLDGFTLASGSGDFWTIDFTVRLWDARSGEHLRTLAGHTDLVSSVTFSPDGGTLASGSRDGIILLWELTPDASSTEFSVADVNQDGVVNILDLVFVAAHFGESRQKRGDINADGIVNLLDLEMVAAAFGDATAAPSTHPQALEVLTAADVRKWLIDARGLEVKDSRLKRGIAVLEQLLAELGAWSPILTETSLLPNYPNPFNPETWLPYRLAKESAVAIRIYNHSGTLIRPLSLGVQGQGDYLSRQEAEYWDGRSREGETVANGVYFYTLTAGDFTATQKMLVSK